MGENLSKGYGWLNHSTQAKKQNCQRKSESTSDHFSVCIGSNTFIQLAEESHTK